MSTKLRLLSVFLPSMLLACTPTEEPNGYIFDLETDGDFALQDYADSTFIVVDPESGGFLTAEVLNPSRRLHWIRCGSRVW